LTNISLEVNNRLRKILPAIAMLVICLETRLVLAEVALPSESMRFILN